MEIVEFEPSMAAEVARCYNDLIAPVPDTCPVPIEYFASLDALVGVRWRLREERVMVAIGDDERVAGFIHVGIALPQEQQPPPEQQWHPRDEPGVIRYLSYRPGDRSIGQALLEWAENWAREHGRAAMLAWHAGHRYAFYHFPWAGLSERIAHVRALLGISGYAEKWSEIHLTWRDFVPPLPMRPVLDFDLGMDWQRGPLGPRLELIAKRDGRRIGLCQMDRGRASPAPDSADWCFCDELDVADEFQGKRLGKFMLAEGLRQMHKVGCRHAAISTGSSNHRAALFYTNLGYRFADQTYSFRKEFSDGRGAGS